ncbi:terminase [Sporanaerobium hydrogeniformans]|uniref:Terminase n=1 Tax=Sporanaerobium hydrogeniformans TaxID=3072179 RepID=A0AC61DAQ3_9FIRM|nr:terminase TerL endonuclease subunit [Sporanaerobium hydrogeniformans]PHV69771.1 terminase [Sporanaerobium hydrogeniformans]
MAKIIQKKLKIIYELTYNPIFEYWEQIKNKEVVVSIKVYKVYKEIVRFLNDPESEWEYDNKKANHALEFIENFCKHSKGKLGGKPFIMELWQKALVGAAFGIVHKIDGLRKYQEVLLIVARKNGKSTLAAAIGLYLQIADGEPGAEIYAAATKKDQAKIIWLEAKRMVKKSPVLSKRIKGLVAELVSDYNDSAFKPLGSDSDTLDGLNVHGALLDEIHAWKDKNLYDVIVDGCTAREQPLIFITTTAGTIRECVYDIKYDEAEMVINGYGQEDGYKNERMLPIIYELDSREEWTDENCWQKANPGLGTIKKISQLSDKVNKAIANNKLVKNLLCKDFNIRETSTEAWLSFEQINNTARFDITELKPRYGIGGIDLSKTTDLTCATVLFMVPGDTNIYVNQMYWIPEDLLEQRAKEDKVPYVLWHDQGLLRTCQGRDINPKDVSDWFMEMQIEHDIYLYDIGYDAWSTKYFINDMESRFGKILNPVIQGKKTLSGPMYQLEADLTAKKIIYNNNPILKWCLTNTAIEKDKNLNIQPCKTNNERRRIDGMASLLDAYVRLREKYEEYQCVI